MRFASLGSGSRGNAALVEVGATTLLVDCGFSARETERRLERAGHTPQELSALLVTHEHSDHAAGVAVFARRHKLAVWMSAGTWGRCRETLGEALAGELRVNLFLPHESFAVGDIEVTPFTVPHDAREPCQFLFNSGRHRLGMLTDVGCITPHVESQLQGCDALFLECNHDGEMLRDGLYPPSLKARVGGQWGHLSNAQAAELLRSVDCSRLQHIVAAHLSEQNNRPELARAALGEALGCESRWVAVADQEEGLDWRAIA